MTALSHGQIRQATIFNPAVVLGVVAATGWFALGWMRFWRGTAPLPSSSQDRRIKRNAALACTLLALNWIYLIAFLP